MKIKKILSMVIAVGIIISMFSGCVNKESTSKDDEKVYKIGLCQLVQHEALDKATEGFQDALKEKLEIVRPFDSKIGKFFAKIINSIINIFEYLLRKK